MESDILEIRRALRDRVVTKVADGSGVNRNTVAEIKNGKIQTASRSTVAKLKAYLGLDVLND